MYILATSKDQNLFTINKTNVDKNTPFDLKIMLYATLNDYLKSEGFSSYKIRGNADNLYWCKIQEIKQKKYIFFNSKSKYKITSFEKISLEELRNQYEELPIEDKLIHHYSHINLTELDPQYFLDLITATYREFTIEIVDDDFIKHYESRLDPARTGESYIKYEYNLEKHAEEKTSSGSFITYTNKDKSKPAYAVISDDSGSFMEILSISI